jgi:hypothetical protein
MLDIILKFTRAKQDDQTETGSGERVVLQMREKVIMFTRQIFHYDKSDGFFTTKLIYSCGTVRSNRKKQKIQIQLLLQWLANVTIYKRQK